MTNTEIGTELGSVAAEVATWVEKTLGIIGWILFWLCAADASGSGDGWAWFAAISCAAMVGVSVMRRTPARWIEELGLSLGFKSALGFGLLFLMIRFSAAPAVQEKLGAALLYATLFSVLLWLITAGVHTEQVEAAWLRFLRFLNGASDNGKTRSVFTCASEPLVFFAVFAFACVAIASPHLVQAAWSFWVRHTPPRIDPMTRGVLPPLELAPALTTYAFWIAVAAISGPLFYISLRRVGLSSAWRGLWVWLSSIAQLAAALVLGTALIVQFQQLSLDVRLIAAGVAVVSAGIVWFCHTRRRHMRGEPLGWNFHWWSTADAD